MHPWYLQAKDSLPMVETVIPRMRSVHATFGNTSILSDFLTKKSRNWIPRFRPLFSLSVTLNGSLVMSVLPRAIVLLLFDLN